MEVLGFHNINDNLFTEDNNSFAETYYDAQNILNFLGWFPALGSVIGGIRIGTTIAIYIGDDKRSERYHKEIYAALTARGIVEILSFGCVFIIPDVITSCSSSMNRNIRFKNIFKRRKIKQ